MRWVREDAKSDRVYHLGPIWLWSAELTVLGNLGCLWWYNTVWHLQRFGWFQRLRGRA